uniref:Glucosamine 6-phosphate N-acetyltransferase n=1 Tax=Chromera velia CCMP2878 TaxID=1169474 RepID=A0A0G4IDN2_9ALVE|eukprot:Cvel_13463.t1-p1 / transcript=Cvel_13463.t1 / gene=Cvel_13463 / organism=Chromera_velia_CCMP2878 / gene_product=Glucosamine 6-phosphate N-acetyltransferase 1, putative / transcript_product=Glucosamine 6-phosphate N-acetyltransferase 1, putative / location=Cvel_scaffold920:60306-61190(+) / protein_length=295 / sequence_SO=supercontig / SO=protein_coding / is_pseudo=false
METLPVVLLMPGTGPEDLVSKVLQLLGSLDVHVFVRVDGQSPASDSLPEIAKKAFQSVPGRLGLLLGSSSGTCDLLLSQMPPCDCALLLPGASIEAAGSLPHLLVTEASIDQIPSFLTIEAKCALGVKSVTLTGGAPPAPPMEFVSKTGKHYLIRPLEMSDWKKGFANLLAQLTSVEGLTEESFKAQLRHLELSRGAYHVIVAEDVDKQKLASAATLLIERKFIRGCAAVGHVEDVVTDAEYRGQGLAREILRLLESRGRAAGCYKIILDCHEGNVPVYEKCGYVKKELQMRLNL